MQRIHLPSSLIDLNSVSHSSLRSGIIELNAGLVPGLDETLHLIRCRNYASAYSASWLAPVDLVRKVPYKDRLTLEWHSHNLYQMAQAGSYKLEEEKAWFVNHMSEFEHKMAKHSSKLEPWMVARVDEMTNAENARVCHSEQEARGSAHGEIIGVIPFYPGGVGNNTETGNAHSISPAKSKAFWLRVVACSLAEWMSTVVVGTCSTEHQLLAEAALKGMPFNHAFSYEVHLFDCEKPVYLPYTLLRHAQSKLFGKVPTGGEKKHHHKGSPFRARHLSIGTLDSTGGLSERVLEHAEEVVAVPADRW